MRERDSNLPVGMWCRTTLLAVFCIACPPRPEPIEKLSSKSFSSMVNSSRFRGDSVVVGCFVFLLDADANADDVDAV